DLQRTSGSTGKWSIVIMPKEQMDFLATAHTIGKGPRLDAFSPARCQFGFGCVGEAPRNLNAPLAIGAQLQRARCCAPEHYSAMPSMMRVWIPRGTVKSAVTSPVSTSSPDAALV